MAALGCGSRHSEGLFWADSGLDRAGVWLGGVVRGVFFLRDISIPCQASRGDLELEAVSKKYCLMRMTIQPR